VSETKQTTERKKKKRRAPTTERRFEAGSSKMPLVFALVGLAGALLAGVGVYRLLTAASLGVPLSVAGLIAVAVALWFGDLPTRPLRVGPFGLGEERPDGAARLRWCELTALRVEGDELVAQADTFTLRIPWRDQRAAAALVLAEAEDRVPDVVDVPRELREQLGAHGSAEAGSVVDVAGLVMTGASCAASEQPITFDADARFCPNCAEVYLRGHEPEKCVSCETPVAGSALALG
jgi:hypothetical protein